MSEDHHLRCTKCGSAFMRRSRTRFWQRPLRLLLLRPYRCRECGHRRYASLERHRARIQGQPDSLSENRFPPRLTHATEGAARIGLGKKWTLAYGLLTCFLIVAIASSKFGNALLKRPSFGGTQSSLPPTNQAQGESSAREALGVKSPPLAADHGPNADSSPLRHANKMPVDAAGKADASIQLVEQGAPLSHQKNSSGSSSAEVIRAPQPRVPADIKSAITSDNIVKVRVRIDKSGKVIDATAVSTSGPVATSLVRDSLDTARRWRFRPARNHGQPVRSDRVIEFLFRPSDS